MAIPPAQSVPALSYQTSRKPPRFSWLTFFASAAILLFIAVVLGTYVPAMKLMFRDFHLELPAGTRILLELSDLFIAGGWTVVIVVPVGLGFLAAWLSSRRPERSAADLARTLDRCIAAMVAGRTILGIIVITHILIWLPMVRLMQAMSPSPSGQ
jgi:hypothetical protein